MKVSVVVLKTGETVITNLQEVYQGDGDDKKGICLMMTHPYKLDLYQSKKKEKPFLRENEVQVQFTRWCAFSKDYQFKIPYDCIMTIGEPEDSLKQAFENKVEIAEAKIKANQVKEEYTYSSDVTVVGAGVQ